MEHQGSWDQNLPYAEFSYNNSYQESLKMAPFKVLYRHRCLTPLNWNELGEKAIFGLDLVEEAEATVCHIQDNFKAAKSRQDSYANKRRRPMEFEVGNHEYLRVTHERREEVWGERKISTTLHWIVSHPQDVWICGLQA
jgi:hypothetical protein